MRYLKQRGTSWHYVRRVPKHVAHLDDRGLVQVALRTKSLEVAKLRRDLIENADELRWHGLVNDDPGVALVKAYEAAVARARAFGFEYKTAAGIAHSSTSIDEIEARINAALKGGGRDDAALLGAVAVPAVTVRKAMELYCDEIGLDETKGMSANQLKSWRKVKMAAAERFVEQVGNKALLDITREDAVKFHRWWMDRVLGKDGDRPLSGNSANRSIGNLRKLHSRYCSHLGLQRDNPFRELSFSDSKRKMKKILPFTADWISANLLTPGKINKLNREARLVLLALVETGCRPSEICNLSADRIRLDAPIPHIVIDFEPGRNIKTENSIREIPLLGVSLEAIKRAPAGFPRYRDKETLLSNTLMKFLRVNEMLPSDSHRVYSLRHSFEKRMLEAGLNDEFRKRMMGHDTDRPDYGDGGELSWKAEQLGKITLPFDKAVLD